MCPKKEPNSTSAVSSRMSCQATERKDHLCGTRLLGWFVLALVAGCPMASPVNPLEDFFPGLEELEEWRQQIEALPSVSVRIVNETAAIAQVELLSGLSSAALFDEAFLFGIEEPFLDVIDSKTVLVAGGGTVEGALKCGEAIGISVSAPPDQERFLFGAEAFGLFVGGGNVALSGIGSAGDAAFTGDIVTGARFVRPEADGIDCEKDTLVIRIETLSTHTTYDNETGVLVAPATLGTGSVSVE